MKSSISNQWHRDLFIWLASNRWIHIFVYKLLSKDEINKIRSTNESKSVGNNNERIATVSNNILWIAACISFWFGLLHRIVIFSSWTLTLILSFRQDILSCNAIHIEIGLIYFHSIPIWDRIEERDVIHTCHRLYTMWIMELLCPRDDDFCIPHTRRIQWIGEENEWHKRWKQ